jgi:hypothetical protein
MESNNDNYGQGEQQLRKRKFNELANDDQPTAAGGGGEQHQPLENLSKKKCEQQGNDALEVCTTGLNKSDFYFKSIFFKFLKEFPFAKPHTGRLDPIGPKAIGQPK